MTTITTSDELRLFNRSRVLSCLRNTDRQSRTSIGEYTGLSAATVTQVTANLIDDGVIRQVTADPAIAGVAAASTRRGRPQVSLELNAAAATTAVLTLLLNHIEVTLYDYAGKQLYRTEKHTYTSTFTSKKLKNSLCEILDHALAQQPHYRQSLRHIEMVYQGSVTSDNETLLWSPITNIRDFNVRKLLQDRYDVPVNVSNDCNTIARALFTEWQSNNKQNHQLTTTTTDNNFAAVLLSYGIGLGFFHQGSILTGSRSSGTEFGHMLFKADGALCRCGRLGCIEAYASDYAIWRRATGEPEHTRPVNHVSEEEFAKLIDIAVKRPGPERDAFIEAGAAIGQGLTNIYALFDPFPTMLVGTTPVAFDLMKESLYKNLSHFSTNNRASFVLLYKSTSENDLIRRGASLQALSFIDAKIFSFGGKTEALESPQES